MKALVIDCGLFPELALRLAREYDDTVGYFTPWVSTFPNPIDQLIGAGLEDFNVQRVDFPFELFDTADEPDVWVFPDLLFSDWQRLLRRCGRQVWGAGWGELLELDRWKFHGLLEAAGWPVADTDTVEGIEQLEEHLRDDAKGGQWIKLSPYYRGLNETYEHRGWPDSSSWLNRLRQKLGPRGADMQFMLQAAIPGEHTVEPGLDLLVRHGAILYPTLIGYEKKGSAIISRVIHELPPTLAGPVETIVAALSRQDDAPYNNFFSAELRVNHQGEAYFIDATCFSEDTEILTDQGWKFFKNLDRSERVATLNRDSREIQYQQPLAYQCLDYVGPMVNLTGGGTRHKIMDLLVTPDHGFWVSARKPNEPLVWRRADSLPVDTYIPRTGIWRGAEPASWTLPEYERNWVSIAGRYGNSRISRRHRDAPCALPIEPWLTFLAAYLADGSIAGKRAANGVASQISIAAYCKWKHEVYRGALEALPWPFNETRRGFHVGSTQLAAYLKQFGVAGEKHIPAWLKQLSPRLIRIFLEAYGDRDRVRSRYFTGSLQMANDLQELIFKSGQVAAIRTVHQANTRMTINGRSYTRALDQYVISERPEFNSFYCVGSGPRAHQYIHQTTYSGKVYDVTVPNGTIYVRRNGFPIWTSNCRMPRPADGAHQDLCENLGAIIAGDDDEPSMTALYAVQLMLDSSRAEEMPLHIRFPEELRPHIKLYQFYRDPDGEYWSLPRGISNIASVVVVGDDLEKIKKQCLEYAKEVKADSLSFEENAFDQIEEDIEQGRQNGVEF